MNEYQERAQSTREWRRKAGKYPTHAQDVAFCKMMQRDGESRLTADELRQLATHPHLAPSQRARYEWLADIAESKVTA